MLRSTLPLVAVMLCMPVISRAGPITISVGNHLLLPETPGQTFNILLSGVDGSDLYHEGELWTTIAGGGPVVTHFDDETTGSITNLGGTVWAGGGSEFGGIFVGIDGTSPGASGQRTGAYFSNNDYFFIPTNGIFVTVTVDTTGVSPGTYAMNLDDHPAETTRMYYNTYDEFFNQTGAFLVPNLVLANGTLTVVPEPSTMILAAFGFIGLAAWGWRRRSSGPSCRESGRTEDFEQSCRYPNRRSTLMNCISFTQSNRRIVVQSLAFVCLLVFTTNATIAQDNDGDGVVDAFDNAPLSYNPSQTDLDADGIGDVADLDLDGDTIDNEFDNAPLDFNQQQEDTDGDGWGDATDPFPLDGGLPGLAQRRRAERPLSLRRERR